MIVIGIDPDAGKSGFAVWHLEQQRFAAITSLSFFDIIDYLKYNLEFIRLVRIEAGWLNKKSNWHFKTGGVNDKVSSAIGKNQMVGKLIAQYCERIGIRVEFVRPLGTKFLNSELFKQATGWTKKTNQDSRDAAMLCWKYGENKAKKDESRSGK